MATRLSFQRNDISETLVYQNKPSGSQWTIEVPRKRCLAAELAEIAARSTANETAERAGTASIVTKKSAVATCPQRQQHCDDAV